MYISTQRNIILAAESIILDEPYSYIVIPIEYEKKVQGNIKIRFCFDESISKSEVKNYVKDNTLVIECINFNNSLGTFSTDPIDVGEMFGKKLSLHIWSSLNGQNKKIRMFQYTLFMEK